MNKIDFVITWVDGSDPKWQAEKEYWQPNKGSSDSRNIRYREWDTLRYWFRCVEKYAPWVNKVHFVTWGHLPKWLNTECPKLNIVCHRDFIPQEYLPTFSSHPIELNMHRIPDLADQFVYFNDDFYLTSPVQPEDFFVNGLPCDSLEETVIPLSWKNLMVYVNSNDILFANMHFSKKEALKRNWKKWFSLRTPGVALRNLSRTSTNRQHFFGLNVHHLPQAYLKDTFSKVWDAEPEWLHETCTHKFRDYRDVSQCVFKFWQLASGQFTPYNKRKYGFYFPGGTASEKAADAIKSQKYKYICYNDAAELDFDHCKEVLREAFESVVPEKCSFEK